MAKHTWHRPYEWQAYLNSLESPEHPEIELVEELDVGSGSYRGAGHAWVVKDTANNVVCLQSYATIVSVQAGAESVDLGNWSRTTAHHQRRFRVWCYNHKED